MERAGLGRGEQLLAELGLQRAQLLVDRLEFDLLGRRQLGTRMHHPLVIDVEKLRLLGVEVQLGRVVVQIFTRANSFALRLMKS